jgi:hypothetical protein
MSAVLVVDGDPRDLETSDFVIDLSTRTATRTGSEWCT